MTAVLLCSCTKLRLAEVLIQVRMTTSECRSRAADVGRSHPVGAKLAPSERDEAYGERYAIDSLIHIIRLVISKQLAQFGT
jgi:hypothetical protein